MTEKPRYWFPAKRHGWGWGLPCAWQGWIVLGTFLGGVAASSSLLADRLVLRSVAISAAGLALVSICWIKGEPPQGRTGKDGPGA